MSHTHKRAEVTMSNVIALPTRQTRSSSAGNAKEAEALSRALLELRGDLERLDQMLRLAGQQNKAPDSMPVIDRVLGDLAATLAAHLDEAGG